MIERGLAYDHRVALRTTHPLAEGDVLTLVVEDDEPPEGSAWYCALSPGTPELEHLTLATFTVGPALPMPTTLGRLSSVADLRGEAHIAGGAGCFDIVPASTVRITLDADTLAEPWLDVMVFETLVDGEPYSPMSSLTTWGTAHDERRPFGGSWQGRGEDLVFSLCGRRDEIHQRSNAELTTGTHTIVMRGVLPDGTVVETEPHTIRLACSSSSGCALAQETRASSRPPIALFALVAVAAIALRRGARRSRAASAG